MVAAPEELHELDAMLAVVRERTGVDFAGYRPATLRRRVANRMIAVRAGSAAAYLERLRREPDEAGRLAERLTIKVSRFFRDPATFARVAAELASPWWTGRALRLWSAGCGHGEEAYTLAMLLADAGLHGSVIATDVDPGALARVTRGVYPPEATRDVPAPLRRFLTPVVREGRAALEVAPALRQRVACARHDLLGPDLPVGAPFDLIALRNVLIYLRPARQREVLTRALDALRPGGLLVLGDAEWPPRELIDRLAVLDRAAPVLRRVV